MFAVLECGTTYGLDLFRSEQRAFFWLPSDGLQAGGWECVDQAVVFGMVEEVVEDGDGEIGGSACPTSFDFCCSESDYMLF